jgi:hypothetical protein
VDGRSQEVAHLSPAGSITVEARFLCGFPACGAPASEVVGFQELASLSPKPRLRSRRNPKKARKCGEALAELLERSRRPRLTRFSLITDARGDTLSERECAASWLCETRERVLAQVVDVCGYGVGTGASPPVPDDHRVSFDGRAPRAGRSPARAGPRRLPRARRPWRRSPQAGRDRRAAPRRRKPGARSGDRPSNEVLGTHRLAFSGRDGPMA